MLWFSTQICSPVKRAPSIRFTLFTLVNAFNRCKFRSENIVRILCKQLISVTSHASRHVTHVTVVPLLCSVWPRQDEGTLFASISIALSFMVIHYEILLFFPHSRVLLFSSHRSTNDSSMEESVRSSFIQKPQTSRSNPRARWVSVNIAYVSNTSPY